MLPNQITADTVGPITAAAGFITETGLAVARDARVQKDLPLKAPRTPRPGSGYQVSRGGLDVIHF